MVCFEAGGGQLRAATGSWVFHEDGDGFDEGGRWRKGYPLRFIVVNLDRSRHIRRRRYTQWWTVFDLPSTPDPGQTLALPSAAASPGSSVATTASWPPPPSLYTRPRMSVFTSVLSRGLLVSAVACAPSRQAGMVACDTFSGGVAPPWPEAPAPRVLLDRLLAIYHARARRTSSSPLSLRRWIGGAPSRGPCGRLRARAHWRAAAAEGGRARLAMATKYSGSPRNGAVRSSMTMRWTPSRWRGPTPTATCSAGCWALWTGLHFLDGAPQQRARHASVRVH